MSGFDSAEFDQNIVKEVNTKKYNNLFDSLMMVVKAFIIIYVVVAIGFCHLIL